MTANPQMKTKTITLEIQVTGSEEEINKEMNLILSLVGASNFSRVLGYGVKNDTMSYGVLNHV